MQIHITKTFREQKTSKAGKPYTSLRIKTQEHGDKWISGFGNAGNAEWDSGTEADVNIVEKGEYLNFEMPKNANGTEKPRPASMSETGETARLANVISIKLLPVLERIAVALEAPQ